MKKMVKLFLIAIISLASAFFVLGGKTEVEAACGLGEYWSTSSKACLSTSTSSNESTKMNNIGGVLETFAYTIIYLSTGLALIMIVYSGFQYTMSEGDSFKIQEAKTNLLRAGIGMLIAFSSYNILGLFDAFRGL